MKTQNLCYIGYIFSLDIYSSIFVFQQNRRLSCACSICTDSDDCLNQCGIDQYFNGYQCNYCLNSCTMGCTRGSDCRLHSNILCKSFTILDINSCNN